LKKLGEILGVLLKRCTSDSPKLFIKIQNASLIVGALATASLAIPVTYPAWALIGISLLIGLSTGIGAASKLPTNNKKVIKETDELIN